MRVSRLAAVSAVLLSSVSVIAVLPASATSFTVSTVPPDANATTAKTLANGEIGTVTSTGKLQTSADPVITLQGGATITNSGTIESTNAGAGRAIRQNTAGNFSITLTNNVGAAIKSNGDTFQLNRSTGTGLVQIDNAGTIQSVGTGGNNGQALDFDADTTTNGTITINNATTGVISSADADAIRPGNRSIINNSGQITSSFTTANAPTGNASGNDGVQFGSNVGTVNNLVGGSITAARHGITADKGVVISNAGTITGSDGSGINIDTTSSADVTTITNSGTITGNALTADGDGVDVDRTAAITNSGTIRAVGIAASGNLNEALAIGGGTIDNQAGGVIRSDQRAITIDDSNLGNAFAVTTITNRGTIRGDNGEAIKITDTLADKLENHGTIIGSVALGGGDDLLQIGEGSIISGQVDGGDGNNDTIEILADPMLGDVINFEKLVLDPGADLELDHDAHFWAVLGAEISGGQILNITGHGHDLFYNPWDSENGYLGGLNYALQDGGMLLAAAPVPATLALLVPDILGLGLLRRRRAN